MVDTGDGVRQGVDVPSPGDGVAVVPDVQNIDTNLGLQNTLAIVEVGLAGKRNGANLEETLVRIKQGAA